MDNRFHKILMAGLVAAGVLAVQPVGTAAQTQPGAATTDRQPATRPADQLVSSGLAPSGRLSVDRGKTQVLQLSQPVTEVSVGDPSVADINLLSPTRLLVTGRAAGSTQLLVFADEMQQVVDVTVVADLAALRTQLEELFPGAGISATESNGRLVLRGNVPDLEAAEQIVQVASTYGEVLNLLEVAGGGQIMLQVVFAEVSRTATAQLGMNFGVAGQDGFGASNIGSVAPFAIGEQDIGGLVLEAPTGGGAVTLFGSGQVGDTAFAAFLAALQENNLLRVLARPNLVAISGEPASFLAGGEFPIPVAQAGGTGASTVTIEFREFGVKLDFVAIALGDGRIRLQCMPEVSDLDFSVAVQMGGFVVPGLTQRRVDTTVELADGQSLAIAGLLSHNVAANKSAIPVLGELPVLGALFRSTRYQRRETELVVFVTPRLVAGVNPAEVPAAPGANWRHPSREELFLLGRLGESLPGRPEGVTPPLYYGPFGFNRVPETQENP